MAALQRAACVHDALADPGFRAARSQGMIGEQPGAAGRHGQCWVVSCELCSPGALDLVDAPGIISSPRPRAGGRVCVCAQDVLAGWFSVAAAMFCAPLLLPHKLLGFFE